MFKSGNRNSRLNRFLGSDSKRVAYVLFSHIKLLGFHLYIKIKLISVPDQCASHRIRTTNLATPLSSLNAPNTLSLLSTYSGLTF